MTTTIILDKLTTITSITQVETTAVIRGVLDVSLSVAKQLSSTMSTSGNNGIVVDNKGASTTLAAPATSSTISTITSSSTSISTLILLPTYSSSSVVSVSSAPSSSLVKGSKNGFGGTMFQNTTSGTNANIGLVIGIPVAIIATVLLVVGIYFFVRLRHRKTVISDERLKSYYDDKYNCRISPMNSSPLNVRTTYEIKPTEGYFKKFAVSSQHLEGSTVAPSSVNEFVANASELSLKDPHTGPVRNSRWNLNTPLSRWFAKQSQGSADSSTSRASLSTGPFSPVLALKEFKLSKKARQAQVDEKSPILPKCPSQSSFSESFTSESDSISKQAVRADFTKHLAPKLQKVPIKKKNSNKPLPPIKPTAVSATSLEGMEKLIYDRIIPTTSVIDKSAPKTEEIYKVVIDYCKNLADELSVHTGEYYKILASHTDGWCLVEQVDRHGNVIVHEGDDYLNDGRGVIPEMCLKKIH